MCGRYTIAIPLEQLMAFFDMNLEISPFLNYTPRYNAAPGQELPVLIGAGDKMRLGPLKWGLIPSWAADNPGKPLINAKAETVKVKPSFRDAFRRRRCLVPADGFYEWKKNADGSRQPYRFQVEGGGIFVMAGLYDTWTSQEGHKISTFTIITTGPNERLRAFHDRMPVILTRQDAESWLSVRTPPEEAMRILRPYPAEQMSEYPVNKKVGNAKYDEQDCLEKADLSASGAHGHALADSDKTGSQEGPRQLNLF